MAIGSPIATSERTIERLLGRIDWSNVRIFVEYGPGTGEFTRSILDRLPADARLIVIESEAGLVAHLRHALRDPRLTVHHGSVLAASAFLGPTVLGKVDYILSGVPFSSLRPSERIHVALEAWALLAPGGQLLAYQVRRSIEPALRLAFREMTRARWWWNLPPYRLYQCRKASGKRAEMRGDISSEAADKPRRAQANAMARVCAVSGRGKPL